MESTVQVERSCTLMLEQHWRRLSRESQDRAERGETAGECADVGRCKAIDGVQERGCWRKRRMRYEATRLWCEREGNAPAVHR